MPNATDFPDIGLRAASAVSGPLRARGSRRTIALTAALYGALAFAADVKLGKPLTLSEPKSITDVLAKPEALVGKTVQVKGKVTEVCKMMGCWMALIDPATNRTLRLKVNDGEITIPQDAVGKIAVAEGTLTKMELSREQVIARAKHEAEEQGRKFDPKSIKQGETVYQIQGSGIAILN